MISKNTATTSENAAMISKNAAMTSENAAMISKKAAKAVRISLTAPLPHQINQINYVFNFYSL